jgi:uncharacterized membrane protein YkoI
VDPARQPHHDHRHGARAAKPGPTANVPHMTLIQAAQYISAQVPGELRQVEAHPGAAIYHVDVELTNGAIARFEVDAHDGRVGWHQTPAFRN